MTNEEFVLLMTCLEKCEYSEKMRAYLALSKYMKHNGLKYMYEGEELSAYAMESRCFDTLSKALKNASGIKTQPVRAVRDNVMVELPVRVNWDGDYKEV